MKAVIPAAGFGTRFLPATKAQPKEMLPFPWEEAKPKEAVILSPKERKERFEEILKRVRNQRF